MRATPSRRACPTAWCCLERRRAAAAAALDELRRPAVRPAADPARLPAGERLPLAGAPGSSRPGARRPQAHAATSAAGDGRAAPRPPSTDAAPSSTPILARAVELGRARRSTPRPPRSTWRARSWSASALAVEPRRGLLPAAGAMSTSSASAATGPARPGRRDRARCGRCWPTPSVLKIGHNIKYDLGMLAALRARASRPIDDTMLISYVLDGASHGHGMDELAQRTSSHELHPLREPCAARARRRSASTEVPIDKATAYAAEDAEVTLRLWQALKPAPARGAHAHRLRDPGAAARRRSSPSMEGHGIKVDAHRPAPALGRVRPAHGRARGRGLQARRPQLQPRLAQAAGRGACSTS